MNFTGQALLAKINADTPKLRWRKEAPSRVGINPDQMIYAEGKAHDYLIKQERDGWMNDKVIGYVLTIDPSTYSPRVRYFDKQREAKEYAQEFEYANKR